MGRSIDSATDGTANGTANGTMGGTTKDRGDSGYKPTRRRVMTQAAALSGLGLAATTTGCISFGNERPNLTSDLGDQAYLALLGTTLAAEHDYRCEIEGNWPSALQGVLYRNGPGRFDRGGFRKNHLLDGDGLIQRFDIANGSVHYRNRFVRTGKFQEEEKLGALRYSTWTTRAPGGALSNVGGGDFRSQAGITVYKVNDALIACDEVGLPYEIDSETLTTIGPYKVGPDNGDAVRSGAFSLKAHSKFDHHSGEWVLLGSGYGGAMRVHLVVHGPDGSLRIHRSYDAPRAAYFHDFAITESHVVVLLHPLIFSPTQFLLGLQSFTDSLTWQPGEGNLVMILDRFGKDEPVYLEAPAAFSWHSLNAYNRGSEMIVDFIGYYAPDHFIGPDAALRAIMQGRRGIADAAGHLRRYIINLDGQQLREEILHGGGFEFPMTAPGLTGQAHRFGYFSMAVRDQVFHTALARIDTETGALQSFDFGDRRYIGEPIFAPNPDLAAAPENASEPGWLLALGLDGDRERAFLAVFDAEHLADGPLALAHLQHPTPISFHGTWIAL